MVPKGGVGPRGGALESQHICGSASRPVGLIRMNAAEYVVENRPVSAAHLEGLALATVHIVSAAHLGRKREVSIESRAQTSPCGSLLLSSALAVDLAGEVTDPVLEVKGIPVRTQLQYQPPSGRALCISVTLCGIRYDISIL